MYPMQIFLNTCADNYEKDARQTRSKTLNRSPWHVRNLQMQTARHSVDIYQILEFFVALECSAGVIVPLYSITQLPVKLTYSNFLQFLFERRNVVQVQNRIKVSTFFSTVRVGDGFFPFSRINYLSICTFSLLIPLSNIVRVLSSPSLRKVVRLIIFFIFSKFKFPDGLSSQPKQ